MYKVVILTVNPPRHSPRGGFNLAVSNKAFIMKNRSPENKPSPLTRNEESTAEDFIWSTSEKTRRRTLSLYIIQAIVEKYGGTIHIDLCTDTINIDVPEKHQVACAQEIEEKVGALGL